MHPINPMTLGVVRRAAAVAALALAVVGLTASEAGAVPAFGAQTGMPCQNCHVGGFGPQLTPFGREFKLQGYTLRTNDKSIPLSAMVVASYLRTQQAQNPPQTPYSHPNDNWALDQVSLFLRWRLRPALRRLRSGHLRRSRPGFWHWDNLDLRATTTVKVDKADVTAGRQPQQRAHRAGTCGTRFRPGAISYTTSTARTMPGTSPVLNGALAQTSAGPHRLCLGQLRVLPGGRRLLVPERQHADQTGRRSHSPRVDQRRGALRPHRLPARHRQDRHVLELGAFGMKTDIYPWSRPLHHRLHLRRLHRPGARRFLRRYAPEQRRVHDQRSHHP